MSPVFISICIPAYKRPENIKRLMASIARQTFKNYEVVITDDSPDDSVKEIVPSFANLPLRYYKNETPLGTPENWNKAISYAKGNWIKLMHDDDWLNHENSLQIFAEATQRYPAVTFFFSAYNNVVEESGASKPVRLTGLNKLFLNNYHRLLAHNVIGPPSVVLYKKEERVLYDNQLKWLVDLDFYIQYLEGKSFYYIDQPLVNIGINKEQVTQSSFRVKEVEIPEHFQVLKKIGFASLKDIVVYDALWRLFRNLNIRSLGEIEETGYRGEIHPAIRKMIAHQTKLSRRLLQIGTVSKAAMLLSYLCNRSRITQ